MAQDCWRSNSCLHSPRHGVENTVETRTNNQHTLTWDFSQKFVALQIISPRSSYSQFNLCLVTGWEGPDIMAVFSALKNKKNQKLREGLEDLALKCGEVTEKDEVNVEVDFYIILLKMEYFHNYFRISPQIDSVVKQLEQLNIKLSEKDLSKLQKISAQDGRIPKYC